MRYFATFAVLLVMSTAAIAADDGQTQPRLSMGYLVNPNTSTDIIGTTSGTGNVKGVLCQNSVGASQNVYIYVNGGSGQLLSVNNVPTDSNGNTGWIPMNVRFTSSVRVQLVRDASPNVYGTTQCVVSWALD
jgi:hypothetical protein